MKRLIIYIVLILFFAFLGYIGLVNQPVDYLSFDVLDTSFYRYNMKTSTYEEIRLTKEKIDYKGDSFDLHNCSKYKYKETTGIIKMDCGRAFRVIVQNQKFLVLNVDNYNYYFFSDKDSSYSKEFNAYFGMTEEDYEFEVNEKLVKFKINSDLFDKLINSNSESFVYIKDKECNSQCKTLSYQIDKLTDNNIYYIEKEDLSADQIARLSENASDSDKEKVALVGNGSLKVIDVTINNMSDDLTGYLDKEVQENE